MAFYIYDITFLIIFSILVGTFLWKRRKRLEREGLLYLYKTKVGIKFINYVGSRYKRTLKVLGYFAVTSGYVLMITMVYLLYKLVYIYLFKPEIVRAVKIPPIMPLVPYVPELFKIDFLPPFYFTYWIIAIAVIAIFHEFAHGVYMKLYNVRIKSTGFGFLGPFLAAFVEQDEKDLERKNKYEQIVILSAGTFTNLVLALIFFLLLGLFFAFAYQPGGAIFNIYTPGAIKTGAITSIGGVLVNNLSNQEIVELINERGLTDSVILENNGNQLNFSEIKIDEKKYFSKKEDLVQQLKTNSSGIVVYEDLPAINAVLKGAITEIDGQDINSYENLSTVMDGYKPGDKIKLTTIDSDLILEYELTLAEDPSNSSRAVMGIGIVETGQSQRLILKIYNFFNFFREPGTYYEPRFNVELVIFVYNLIWWLALINLSVALVNMWPMNIFDGGRMFMLTVWGITGSEKFAKLTFKLVTYVILGSLLLLMIGWFFAIF